jgi:hypothetical protein
MPKITKLMTVNEATYSEEADSIVMVCECEEGKIRHQIHSSAFDFGNKDKDYEMAKTAELMVGKKINVVFDPKESKKKK